MPLLRDIAASNCWRAHYTGRVDPERHYARERLLSGKTRFGTWELVVITFPPGFLTPAHNHGSSRVNVVAVAQGPELNVVCRRTGKSSAVVTATQRLTTGTVVSFGSRFIHRAGCPRQRGLCKQPSISIHFYLVAQRDGANPKCFTLAM